MQRLSQIVEFTRKELLNAVDPNFIHHAQYYKELPVKSDTGAKYQGIKLVRADGYLQYEVIFKTGSATTPGKSFYQKIIIKDLRELLRIKDTSMTVRERVDYAIDKGDLLLSCTCPAFCLHADTGIKLIDGRSFTVSELKTRFDAGEQLYASSVDSSGRLKPGKISKVWVSGYSDTMIKITLDNGRTVLTTPSHEYMLRDGTYKDAQSITVGTSLMPLYFNEYNGYEHYLDNSVRRGRRIKAVHTVVAMNVHSADYERKYAELVLTGKERYLVVHHKDFNKRNNHPDNLCWMGNIEHKIFHATLVDGHRDTVAQGIMDYHCNPANFEKIRLDRSNAGHVCAEAHPELVRKFTAACVAASRSTTGRMISSESMVATWRLRRDYMLACVKNVTGEQRFAQAARMSITSKILFSNADYKRAVIDRLKACSKTDNIMHSADGALRMGIGRVMGISAEALMLFDALTPDSYDAVAATRGKNFRWERYFKSFSDVEFWFYAAFNGRSTILHKKSFKLLMLDECRDFANRVIIKQCSSCGKDFIAKYEQQMLCSKACKISNFAHARNHKVVATETIRYHTKQPVYDISVDDYHNFCVDAGVILHNCFWGYKYILTALDAIHPGYKETRQPKIRNPQERGIMCKHAALALTVLPLNASSIAKSINARDRV